MDHHSYEGGAGMKKSQYTRQKLTGNYFITPNVVFDLHLHAYELVIYAYLLRIEDRNTYECLTSYSKIAKKLGLSINTVAKYVRRLEEHGLIETEHTDIITQDGLKRNGCLRYHILPIQYAVDLHHKPSRSQNADRNRAENRAMAQGKQLPEQERIRGKGSEFLRGLSCAKQ